MADATVTLTGPLFDGRAPAEIRLMLDEAKNQLGQQALADVHANLNKSIQHPTPYYETQIIEQVIQDDLVVHDRGIIYGPWLEGEASRNTRTRFKGYHSFRKAFQELQRKAPQLLDRVVARHLGRLR